MINFKWIKLFLVFLLSFVLQTTVGDWLQIFGVGPDFIVILIVAIAIKYGSCPDLSYSADSLPGLRRISTLPLNGLARIRLP